MPRITIVPSGSTTIACPSAAASERSAPTATSLDPSTSTSPRSKSPTAGSIDRTVPPLRRIRRSVSAAPACSASSTASPRSRGSVDVLMNRPFPASVHNSVATHPIAIAQRFLVDLAEARHGQFVYEVDALRSHNASLAGLDELDELVGVDIVRRHHDGLDGFAPLLVRYADHA